MIDSFELEDEQRVLCITWATGEQAKLTAKILRENARDAASLRAQIDGTQQPVSETLSISEITVLGHGALNICFSDGHDRAIYPIPYLRELSVRMTTN